MATMMVSRNVSGAEVESLHLIYKYKGGGEGQGRKWGRGRKRENSNWMAWASKA